VNRNTLRALLADARYQVFDNVVFRILLGAAALIVILSFCIQFGDDSISIFFGTWDLSYGSLGGLLRSTTDPKAESIQFLQEGVVEVIAGNLGIMLCIAATAFFTPRMLEKGSADNIFSKPVGRFTLLLSRYFAGLLFVGVLSFLMVFGMQAGLSIMSGYNDWGFLWSALTLVYIYAILQAFSIMVATVTRNSVASILLTMILFMFTGCANSSWIGLEWVSESAIGAMIQEESESAADEAAATDELAEGEEPADDETSAADAMSTVKSFFYVCRSVLPRTGDADILARKLRRSIAGRPADVFIKDGDDPVFHLITGAIDLEFDGGGLAELDGEGLNWSVGGTEGGTLNLRRLERPMKTTRSGRERKKPVREIAAEHREEIVAEHGQVAMLMAPPVQGSGRRLDWTVLNDDQLPLRSRVLITSGDKLFELNAKLPAGMLVSDWENQEYETVTVTTVDENGVEVVDDGSGEDETEGVSEDKRDDEDVFDLDPVQDFMLGASFAEDPTLKDANVWYESKFGWTAPWDYNAWVSIGTSFSFALVMLLLACWRIRRTDF
jgi:ABC-type transport system involved in multi-copper enzyme maturation permease subunit